MAEPNLKKLSDLHDENIELKKEIERLKAEREWISVVSELPKESGRYWCHVEEVNDLGISHYQWNCSYNAGENRWSDQDHFFVKVTHWMPLPVKPKQ